MIKRMTAKFNGKCAISGAPIYIGDDITYDTVSRKAYLLEHDDAEYYAFKDAQDEAYEQQVCNSYAVRNQSNIY